MTEWRIAWISSIRKEKVKKIYHGLNVTASINGLINRQSIAEFKNEIKNREERSGLRSRRSFIDN